MPFALKKAIEKEINHLEQDGIIEKTTPVLGQCGQTLIYYCLACVILFYI